MTVTWQQVAAQKQADRQAKLPAAYLIPPALMPDPSVKDVSTWHLNQGKGFFTAQEIEITDSTASQIVKRIASGELSAVQVLLAVSKRAAVAQQLLNCVTEICFDQGLERAKTLDAYFAQHGTTVGPLHGLPISFKDQFQFKGVDACVGYVAWCNNLSTEDSTLVTLLVAAGAVLYVKTNIPTTLMMGESVNNVFGFTSNPFNRTLTSGGSSGGESALVSARGSFLGIGTDIGGSIRAPCSLTGLYGLRPSHGRVSYQLAKNSFMGQEAIRSCAGPMCRSPADIRLFMSALCGQKGWTVDPQLLPLPWRAEEEILPTQLVFAMTLNDGRVTPSPPILRAMEITRAKLVAAGHKVIDWIPAEHLTKSVDIAMALFVADGGEDITRDIQAGSEPMHHSLEVMTAKPGAPKMSVYDTWQNQRLRDDLATSWAATWNATAALTGSGRPFDGMILPATPLPAMKHSKPGEPIGTTEYCLFGCLAPLLQLTTGTFPVTKVDLELDVLPKDFKPLSEHDSLVNNFYATPLNHENAPIGLSITAGKYEEEKVVAMLAVIEAALAK